MTFVAQKLLTPCRVQRRRSFHQQLADVGPCIFGVGIDDIQGLQGEPELEKDADDGCIAFCFFSPRESYLGSVLLSQLLFLDATALLEISNNFPDVMDLSSQGVL